jgi:hypothetical protein
MEFDGRFSQVLYAYSSNITADEPHPFHLFAHEMVGSGVNDCILDRNKANMFLANEAAISLERKQRPGRLAKTQKCQQPLLYSLHL